MNIDHITTQEGILPPDVDEPERGIARNSSRSPCSARFVYEPSHDWGAIRDTKHGTILDVSHYVEEGVEEKCRKDGTDPYIDRVNEMLEILNFRQNAEVSHDAERRCDH